MTAELVVHQPAGHVHTYHFNATREIKFHQVRNGDTIAHTITIEERSPGTVHLDIVDPLVEQLRARIEQLRARIETLEELRPHWAQGYTSDSVAAQVTTAALSELWRLLGVHDQTTAVRTLRALLNHGDQA